jgi:hypothetical protein
MILNQAEIRHVRTRVKAAFPRFKKWNDINEADDDHDGYAIWGEFTPKPGESMPRSFFVTFDMAKEGWRGHLTIGKHCYYWSSADVGDAYLLDTDTFPSLDEAIAALKGEIGELFAALSGSKAAG